MFTCTGTMLVTLPVKTEQILQDLTLQGLRIKQNQKSSRIDEASLLILA